MPDCLLSSGYSKPAKYDCVHIHFSMPDQLLETKIQKIIDRKIFLLVLKAKLLLMLNRPKHWQLTGTIYHPSASSTKLTIGIIKFVTAMTFPPHDYYLGSFHGDFIIHVSPLGAQAKGQCLSAFLLNRSHWWNSGFKVYLKAFPQSFLHWDPLLAALIANSVISS